MEILTTTEIKGIVDDFIIYVNNYYPSSYALFDLLRSTGCRIKEATIRTRWSVTPPTFQLKPLKGNNIRDFTTADLSQTAVNYLINFPPYPQEIPQRKYQVQFDNFKANRIILRGEKPISTHLFRHNYARQLRQSGLTDIQIQKKLGETQLASALEYLNTSIRSNYYSS